MQNDDKTYCKKSKMDNTPGCGQQQRVGTKVCSKSSSLRVRVNDFDRQSLG